MTVYECLSEWGQILCAVCPNPKLVITGGTSTVVCVWEMGTSKEKAKPLTLKQVTAAWAGRRAGGQTAVLLSHQPPEITRGPLRPEPPQNMLRWTRVVWL